MTRDPDGIAQGPDLREDVAELVQLLAGLLDQSELLVDQGREDLIYYATRLISVDTGTGTGGTPPCRGRSGAWGPASRAWIGFFR